MNLQSLTYDEAERLLVDKTDEELLDVLAGNSRRLGDTAFGILRKREKATLVIKGLNEKKIKRRDGKVRALNLLLSHGQQLPDAYPVYLAYAGDTSYDAVSCACFGLAFWQNKEAITELNKLRKSKHWDRISLAIDSIEEGDPKIYSPYFHDSSGVWKNEANQAAHTTPTSAPR